MNSILVTESLVRTVRNRVQDTAELMVTDTQDPFALNNLLRQNLQTKEDQLVALGRHADIYERLTASMAPSIWEMDDVKKGILCQLFGAVNKVWASALFFKPKYW